MTLLLALVLAWQGISGLPSQTGTVTGTVRNPDGKPGSGIRIGAVTRPDSAEDALTSAAIVSLAETDESGRFRLENIPPGRYYISAGRVDLPTYYPGTLYMTDGVAITVAAGAALSGIDFTLNANSTGRSYTPTGPASGPAGMTIPLQVQVEGNGKIPVFSSGGYAMVHLTRADGSRVIALLGAREVSLPAVAADFKVSVAFLPPGYAVKSITSGTTDLMNTPFRAFANSGAAPLSITLAAGPPPSQSAGVRVTGRLHEVTAQPRWIYISDIAGTLFSDGSFEFQGVPPGRHSLVTLDNPLRGTAYAASLVIGNQDLDGVVMQPASVLPHDVRASVAGDAINTVGAGKVLPLAVLRGRVSKAGAEEAPRGTVFLVGLSSSSHTIDANGTFEIPGLLPGKYDLEIQAPGYPTVRRSITMGEADLDIDLSESFSER